MRATTMLDPLESLAELKAGNSIPASNQPWFSVGEVVRGVNWEYSRFYLEQLLKASKKGTTKKIIDFLQQGEQLEYSIAGIEAHYALPTMTVSNQCYLHNGQCHSGLTWQYKVLIKGVLDERKVCVIPNVWICERDFIPLVEIDFQDKQFYKDDRNHVYKCVFRNNEPAFSHVGHMKSDGNLIRNYGCIARRLTHWQRRYFQPYTLPSVNAG